MAEIEGVNLNRLSGREAANSVIFVPFMLLKTTKLNISIVYSFICMYCTSVFVTTLTAQRTRIDRL